MATNVIISNGVQPTTTSITSLYTSPVTSLGTRIIAFTACNPVGTTNTYSVWIVPASGTADNTNRIISVSSLITNESESPPELQNHLIPPGGTLQVQVSTGTTINFRSTGIQF